MRILPSRVLQVLALGHAGVGVLKYRHQLRGIVDDGVVDGLAGDPRRVSAFWFLCLSPVMWLTGRLLRDAESGGDLGAQRVAGAVLAGTGAVGVTVLPRSPFWAVLATGAVGALRPVGARRAPGAGGR